MNWGPERYGPLLFTLGAPLFVLCTSVTAAILWHRLPDVRPRTRLLLHTAMSVALGVLMAAWVHFAPCLVYICDGGYYDNPAMRVVASWVGGPSAAAFAATLFARLRSIPDSPKPVTEGIVVATVTHQC